MARQDGTRGISTRKEGEREKDILGPLAWALMEMDETSTWSRDSRLLPSRRLLLRHAGLHYVQPARETARGREREGERESEGDRGKYALKGLN